MQSNIVMCSCDNCGKKLKTCNNHLNIVTSKSESCVWRRIHVKIENVSGVNNNAETRNADLCQKCAVQLLKDAIKRIESGERVSAGMGHVDQQRWN